MILVAGATGLLGAEVCRQARVAGRAVRGIARAGSPRAPALREIGVDVITGDLRVQGDVERACDGVTQIVSTATAMGTKDKQLKMRDVDLTAQLRLVDVATKGGVEHFVFVSASPTLGAAAPLIRYKRDVERAVRESGMHWTILQPSAFMEVWLGPELGWDIAVGKARVFGPGTGQMGWISIVDVAAYALQSLDDPRLLNTVIPLRGPEAVAPNDVVAMFSELSGRPFKVERVPLALLKLLGPVIGLFDEGIASGMSMGVQTAGGDVVDNPLQHEIGLPLIGLREYARGVLGVRPA